VDGAELSQHMANRLREESGGDQVGLDVFRYDPVTQILDANHVHLGTDGQSFMPIRLRLANPPEFDLVASIAGLRLRDRWATAGSASRSPRAAGDTSAVTNGRAGRSRSRR